MLLTLKVTAAQIAAAKETFKADHATFYGQTHGFRCSQSAKAHELFNVPAGTLNHGYNEAGSLSGWITSGGNVVIMSPQAGTVTYCGTRHGIALLWVLEKPKSHKVLSYESSMPFLAPFETLDTFAYRAALDSVCPIARGLALLKSGKPLQFLHTEGLPVAEIKRVYDECVARGYLPV